MTFSYEDLLAGFTDLNCEYRPDRCDTDYGDYGAEIDPTDLDFSDLDDWWGTTDWIADEIDDDIFQSAWMYNNEEV